jgi:hypothetical protein
MGGNDRDVSKGYLPVISTDPKIDRYNGNVFIF